MRVVSYLVVFAAGNLCGFVVFALWIAAKRKNEFFENVIQNRAFHSVQPGSIGHEGNKTC